MGWHRTCYMCRRTAARLSWWSMLTLCSVAMRGCRLQYSPFLLPRMRHCKRPTASGGAGPGVAGGACPGDMEARARAAGGTGRSTTREHPLDLRDHRQSEGRTALLGDGHAASDDRGDALSGRRHRSGVSTRPRLRRRSWSFLKSPTARCLASLTLSLAKPLRHWFRCTRQQLSIESISLTICASGLPRSRSRS